MVAQSGAFSTTLLLIESQGPVVSNKTDLIERVYKNPCTAGKDLFFQAFLLYLFTVFSEPRRASPCMWHKEIRFIPLHIKKEGCRDAIQRFQN